MLTSIASAAADAPTVSFAGGAVRFPLDFDAPHWHVSELPVGRTIRLILTPGEPPQRMRELDDGIWISFRPAGSYPPASSAAMIEPTVRRIGQDYEKARIIRTQHGELAGWQAAWAWFETAASNPEMRMFRHLRIVARRDASQFSAELRSPGEQFAAREAVFSRLMDTVRLETPAPQIRHLPDVLADAAPILGAWKALGSRLSFHADGRAVIYFDKQKNYRLDDAGRYDYRKPVRRIAGQFAAAADLLEITFEDGSRLNYRWRVEGGQLFLTDHHGRISQLERLFH